MCVKNLREIGITTDMKLMHKENIYGYSGSNNYLLFMELGTCEYSLEYMQQHYCASDLVAATDYNVHDIEVS